MSPVGVAPDGHREVVRPLLLGGRRALVDGHPICGACGAAVVPSGPDRWRHLPAGQPYPRRSRWLAPVTLAELRKLPTYEDFAARYPDAVRPAGGPATATTRQDWLTGRHRLEAYESALGELTRRRLGPADNPYLDLVAILAGGPPGIGPLRVAPGLARVLDLPGRRRELAGRLAWAMPSEAALALVADHSPVLDGGAGTGYWAALLHHRGADVRAVDASPPAGGGNRYHPANARRWAPVERLDTVAAVRGDPHRTLLLCWPPPDDDTGGYLAVRAYRGDTLLYVGGDRDGPTGTTRLHRELALNWTPTEDLGLPSWPGVPDRLTVWRRNAVRHPYGAPDRCPDCGRFQPVGTVGRCDRCFAATPPALAVLVNGQRVEYPRHVVDRMPPALRAALHASPNRVHPSRDPEPGGTGAPLRSGSTVDDAR
ncbi:class I SAM-dependent methyltransferase [Micromonospora sp. NBC_01796]|uniref:class I SAM-dependent methyltransferase n=1 Tax=Micromonospora sp. NBC_01796 TaxID=2975987 RepID=UPI002DD852C6|nr:class I SAM-dependent methyltransferase [Micromonospora sp. NBC_01796]WSA84271.1 class I SAM-dependent methyltransferase [Micromonospora sp. NBC_01796]